MNTRVLAPEDYWRAIVSRKWLVISAILVALSIAGTICIVMPKRFRSGTKMWVEGAKIQESLVKGDPISGANYVPTLEDRAMEVRQFLMGRKLLSQVGAEFNLYGYDKDRPDSQASENAIRAIRGGIKVEPTKDKLFIVVSFADEDATLARDVTTRIADLFIEETLREREQGVVAAEEFLQQEIIRAKAELEVKEKVISEYKQQHLGELPQQIDANLHKLDRLQDDMKAQNEMVQTLSNRLDHLDKAIKSYEETGEEGDIPGSSTKRNRDPRLARIKELERRLVELSSMYKETYPDLVQIKEEMKKLKEMTTAQYRDLLPDTEDSEQPVFGKKTKKRAIDPYHAEMLKQREEIVLQLDAIKRRQVQISAEMVQYERRVERTPEREQKLKTLERDYENLQKNYQSLLDKKLSAGIAGNLEKRRKGAKFSIVDPAYKPIVPEVPNIPLVMLGGLALGCAFGFGGAIGLELLGRGFRSAEEVEVTLGLPVIASIPLYEGAFGGTMQSVRAVAQRSRATALLSADGEKESRELATLNRGPGMNIKQRAGQLPNVTPGLELVSMWRPLSFVAEQYRVAATRLELMGGDRKNTVVVVTSAVMGEGKSSTALNLGYVLAKDLDRRTLVLDCDFKRPMQHIYAGVWQQPGLAEVLRGVKPVEDCLQRMGDLGPWILSAGSVADSPLTLSKMHEIADLLAELREKFEYIIVDAPPVLPLADMHVLASMADVLAYVIKASVTGRDVVQKALKALGDTGNIGIILNGLDAHTTPYYMQQEYYREAHHEQLK
ncbi:MAG TPA: AAA family ATPase [Nitrospiraceae bacterium]|nr:AAA family ATPase [Nitrospiraceae bacterium]